MEPTNPSLLLPPEAGDDMSRYRWTICYITVIVTLVFIMELLQLLQEGSL